MLNQKNFIDILEVGKMDRREKQMVINYDNLKEIYGEEIIEKLGPDYVNIIENDVSYLENL